MVIVPIVPIVPKVGFVERVGAQFVLFTKHALIFAGPIPIILDVGPYIWVPANRAALKLPKVTLVTDGRKGFDLEGNCIVAVPVGWCSFISAEYADQLATFIEMGDSVFRKANSN